MQKWKFSINGGNVRLENHREAIFTALVRDDEGLTYGTLSLK